ncbi:MAG: rRNA (guanosine2251-2-O)-methyltransferase [Solirubrobacteraceae bacterium]|nr:rRNA (guanosine2251-2-O)-methyltransferase [Solirubrobacteraceae bacterium]
MIVYGRNAVREALRGKRPVSRVWADKNAIREPWLQDVPVKEVQPADLESLTGSRDHQGVAADAGDYPYADAGSLLTDEDALVVVLDEVQDPHNLGAVARVAETAGAAGLVIPERRAAQVTPAVAKASAGAIEHLPIARVRNIADYLAQARDAGAWIYGADAAGVPYTEPDYSGRKVLVLGSEGKGLRPRVASACDQLIALPVRGKVESLNVSTAAAALVYGILQSDRS